MPIGPRGIAAFAVIMVAAQSADGEVAAALRRLRMSCMRSSLPDILLPCGKTIQLSLNFVNLFSDVKSFWNFTEIKSVLKQYVMMKYASGNEF